MSEIFLIPELKATERLVAQALIRNPMAKMFKQSLEKFIQRLYELGFVLAQADSSSLEIMNTSFKAGKPVTIGKIIFFAPEYAKQMVIAQAELAKLPVNMIKKDLENTVLDLYSVGYILGCCPDVETQEKVKNLLAGTGTVKLVLKPQERAPQDATLQDHP